MRTALAMALLLVPAIWLAAPAGAAPASLQVSPTSEAAGGSVQVSGTCEANTSGFAISNAFLHDASHDFAGVGAAPFQTDAAGNFSVAAEIPASIAPGSYNVTARCGGGNLGLTATLTVTASGTPTGVPAGSGGFAATNASGGHQEPITLAVLGGALVVVGGIGVARRRTSR